MVEGRRGGVRMTEGGSVRIKRVYPPMFLFLRLLLFFTSHDCQILLVDQNKFHVEFFSGKQGDRDFKFQAFIL